jgi:hypothetical protein
MASPERRGVLRDQAAQTPHGDVDGGVDRQAPRVG